MTFISAIALVEAIEQTLGLQAKIKWPNDVMIDGKKTAGILTEIKAEMERIYYIVVGIGINANNTRFPKALRANVTSLALEAGRDVSRIQLVQALLHNFERWYQITKQNDIEHPFERWRAYSCTLGNRVHVNVGEETLEGLAIRLGANGSLYLLLDSGQEQEILAGDVTMVASV
ncbi:biotin--[acetyl-CoA-carboxylase] ligase [candidate division KSB3 bacterium]|uniref:Biotin--[acetyl-CoA-carboxylase] ligase n=1 Tax=candidate division KSB3 bacterium TaxID=2044937 RepID=A0A9D5JSI0_9BACT|nr:biotin--[acetyl-CoA-carboxylase] ligase [candidate division KSB3 bacterium]MBD3323448.1 biotin--[acetyl-CoA-carboxylase] ligase [candidate division KSB3 bacterium]